MDEYRVRRSLAEPESTFTLDAGMLTRSLSGAIVQQMALSDVRGVRLVYQPATGVARWVCVVQGVGHGVSIPSASFLGLGRFESRATSFRPFVAGLTQAIFAAQPGGQVHFQRGSLWARYSSLFFIICFCVIAVLLAFAALGAAMGGVGLAGLSWIGLPALITAMAFRIVWPIWTRNKIVAFDPSALPSDIAA